MLSIAIPATILCQRTVLISFGRSLNKVCGAALGISIPMEALDPILSGEWLM